MPKLLVTENGSDREVSLESSVLEIGRDAENQVVISDPRSSRKHCRVRRTPQGWVLEDLKSRNGTTLNGERVDQGFLKDGDEFHIGKARFRFRAEADAPVETESGPKTASAAKTASATQPESGIELELPESLDDPDEADDADDSDEEVSEASGPAGKLSGFYLEGTEGTYFGKRIAIDKLPFTIGRKKDNDFVLEDPRASSYHATVLERDGRYYVKDKESRNGTLLNNKRISSAPLTQGSLLKLGESTFRVELPPGAVTSDGQRGDAGAEHGEVAEDDFAHFDAREFLEGGGRGVSPVQVGALLVVLGTLIYFAVDVALKLVRPPDPDPSPAGNEIANWSFEARSREVRSVEAQSREVRGEGAIPGWTLFEEEGASEDSKGEIKLTPEGAQFPGRSALRLAPRGGLCRAAAIDIPVSQGTTYRLAAHVENRGAFVAGVAVSWIAEADGKRIEVGRDWGQAISDRSGSEEIERYVEPPQLAVFARVMPFAAGAGGSDGYAVFDQVFFGAATSEGQAGGTGGAAGGEGAPGGSDSAFPIELTDAPLPAAAGAPGAAARGAPVHVSVGADGRLLNFQRGARPAAQAIWVGLAPQPEVDPHVLGHRLATRPRDTGERDGVLFSGQLPDFQRGAWFGLVTQVASQAGEIVCQYRFQPAESGDAAPEKAAIYIEPGTTLKEMQAFGGSLTRPVDFRPDKPVEGPLDELIFGSQGDQVVLFMVPQVKLRAIPHPEANGRHLLVAETAPLAVIGGGEGAAGAQSADKKTRHLTVRISSASRREREAASGLLAQADELYRAGKSRDARARLAELRSRYPWRQDDQARAADMEKAWNSEAERMLKELQAGLDDLKESPAPVIRDALRQRMAKLADRFEASPSEAGAKLIAADLGRLDTRSNAKEEPADPDRLLTKAREHLDRDQLGLADLCRRLAQAQKLEGDLARRATDLEKLLQERRSRRAEQEVR